MGNLGGEVTLTYSVLRTRPDWELPEWELEEGTVPESFSHDQAVELLRCILAYWATPRGGLAVRNLAIRWVRENPRIGLDPDVAVLATAPADPSALTSLRTWEGHAPPSFAVEVVSPSHPYKDYGTAPEKYAVMGTGELCVFDPLLCGPRVFGGPHRLQLWVRDERRQFVRVYAGPGPVRSPTLGAWLVATDEGQKLRVANDEAATDLWLTAEETALARIAELEAELAKRR